VTTTTTIDRIRRYQLFWTLLLVTLLLDQASKWWVILFSGYTPGFYPPFSGTEVIPGVFNLVYTTNPGAAWGMFSGFGFALAILGFITLILLFVFRRDLEVRQRSGQLAFGLITGGIVGNTIDRIVHGHVIDFIDIDLQFYRWPTFNIADCGIVVGAGLYIIHAFISDSRSHKSPEA
jgi:signal peptidase II